MASNPTRNVLNVSPLLFDDAEVEVGVFRFPTPEDRDAALRLYRQKYRLKHVFRRDDANSLISLPIQIGEQVLGQTTKTIRLSKNLGLCAVLMREAVLNFRIRWRQLTRGYHPLEFVGTGPKDDLLTRSLQSVPSVDTRSIRDWLSIRAKYELDIRVFELENRAPFLGMAVGVSSDWRVLANAEDFIRNAFSLNGFYVGTYEDEENGDPRLESRFRLQGQVCGQSKDGKTLFLQDGRDGRTELEAEIAFVNSYRSAVQGCFGFLFGQHADAVQEALDAEIASLMMGPGRLEKTRGLIQRLQGRDFELAPDIPVTIGELMSQEEGTLSKVQTAPRPIYIFDALGEQTDFWHERGLREHGPHSSDTFTPNRPRICVVCQKSKRGRVDVFLKELLHGLPPINSTQTANTRFAKGLFGLYHLEKVVPEVFEATDDSAKAYKRAANAAIAAARERNWDLAIVQTEERFHDLFGDDNPYLVTKSAFLMQGILTQEFELETASLPKKQLAYALNNIALACYAKLDGTPWVLRANSSITHELVIGMGSATIGEGRLGKRERVVGITTVFSNFGSYYLHNVSRAASMDEFEEVLLDSLQHTIGEVRKAHNWQPRQAVRLIFHGFKPMKDEQVQAVKGLMETLGDLDVSYAFLHIVQDHPYVLFDEAQQGVENYSGHIRKGVLAPLRGQYLPLSGSEMLLSLTGAQEVLQAEHGIPRPVLLRLHRGSTFTDLTYLARQVYFFASHSWRAFTPSALPVTVDYSRMMARLLGQLDTTTTWQPDVLIGRTGTRRWFL